MERSRDQPSGKVAVIGSTVRKGFFRSACSWRSKTGCRTDCQSRGKITTPDRYSTQSTELTSPCWTSYQQQLPSLGHCGTAQQRFRNHLAGGTRLTTPICRSLSRRHLMPCFVLSVTLDYKLYRPITDQVPHTHLAAKSTLFLRQIRTKQPS